MKNKIMYIAILITGLTFVSMGISHIYGQTTQNTTTMKQSMKYTCPQHPEVVSDKPGKCSKCGMELVAMNDKTTMKRSTGMNKKSMKMTKNSTQMKSMKKNGMMKDSKGMGTGKKEMKKDSTGMGKMKM